jgi:1-acyl-sn-glycerol-3-phosphate acyltransferase
MNFLRSTLFNLSFYLFNTLACIFCAPALALAKREFIMKVVHWYVRRIEWLERHIMGLTYEVRGKEYLPEEGPYIIAAKHQSPYETFKLHLLFDDPAIVLKKELLVIPVWGSFLAKIDPIAINRSAGREAMNQIIEGAKRIKDQGRAIVIFPQGTRVYPDQTPKEKPYKMGVARIQEATNLPVIPMALNSGVFWPRSGWMKKSGTVVFEFLPPIEPGREPSKVIHDIEYSLETASNTLRDEALDK